MYTVVLSGGLNIANAVFDNGTLGEGFSDFLTGGQFCNLLINGVDCPNTSGNYALDIVAPSATVPEPAFVPLGAVLFCVGNKDQKGKRRQKVNFVRKSILPLAGVAAIVLVLSMAGPRAVHAVTAALVQVMNTPTSAVPAVQAPAVSQIYSGLCQAVFNASDSARCGMTAVPAGQTLFVETISVQAGGLGAPPATTQFGGSSGIPLIFVPMFSQASGDAYIGTVSARVAVKAGDVPTCAMIADNIISGRSFFCVVNGYLAPAQ